MELKYWPIEYVRWDPVFRVYKARADPNTVQPGDIPDNPGEYGFVGGYWLPIIHGDGRWVIFKKNDIDPFRHEAALLPAALGVGPARVRGPRLVPRFEGARIGKGARRTPLRRPAARRGRQSDG